MRTVGPEEYFQPVGYLAGVKEVPPAENDRPGTEFDCEMMVRAGLASAQVDAVSTPCTGPGWAVSTIKQC